MKSLKAKCIQLLQGRRAQSTSMLVTAAIGIVVLVIASGFGISMLADMRTENTSVAEGDAYDEGISGVGKFPAKAGLIAGVIVMVFIIGLLMFLAGRAR